MDPIILTAIIAASGTVMAAVVGATATVTAAIINGKRKPKVSDDDAKQEPVPDERHPISSSVIEISDYWKNLPDDHQYLFLAYTLGSSQRQKAETFTYIASWTQEQDLDEIIEKTEFFLGPYWGNKVFNGKKYGNRIGFKTSANGNFLCVCRITFRDPSKEQLILHQYVDITPLENPS